MEFEDIESLDLYVAKKVKDEDYFFCKIVGSVSEKGYCGKGCIKYNPRNKKSGCCKHYSKALFEKTDEKITIKRKPNPIPYV